MPREALGAIGDYELLELVGRGGMAQVYRARSKKTGQVYALKVLIGPAVLDDTIAARFRREAEVIQTITHEAVVRLIDFGTTPDYRNYLVMEWVEGRPLSDAISREAPFAPARAADISRKIAGGLGAIHAHDFVHRDLKPQNIMLIGQQEESLKIVDFGLVSGDVQLWERLTRTGEIVGTPLYMAPESIEGRSVDARTDLYSLGVIMYEMLSGDLPFSSQSIPEILDRHLSAKPPRLRPMGGVENVAMALLEKNPAMRFIDAAAVIAALDALELQTRPGLDLETNPGTPRTRPSLTSTVGYPPQAAQTAEGPLTQPYPVQTWAGKAHEKDESVPDETIRIPIGRAETDLEDSDDTEGFDDPTHALGSLPEPIERTASFEARPLARDGTPLRATVTPEPVSMPLPQPPPSPAKPTSVPPVSVPPPTASPSSVPPMPAPSSVRESKRRREADTRKFWVRVLFFVFGAILATAAIHWLTRKPQSIEIQVAPTNKPRATSRPVEPPPNGN